MYRISKVKTEDLKGSCIHEGYITATELCASVGHKSEGIRGDFNGRSDFYPPFESELREEEEKRKEKKKRSDLFAREVLKILKQGASSRLITRNFVIYGELESSFRELVAKLSTSLTNE